MTPVDQAIGQLQTSYMAYMASLKAVLDLGEANIGPLIAALNQKHANPVAKALGLMMYAPASEQAIPKLLDWLIMQSPMYPEVLEALVRAGDRPVPYVLQRLEDYSAKNDDEAVRNLLDLACRFSDAVMPNVVNAVINLLRHENPNVRETAADAIWRIGLPHGRQAEADLRHLVENDNEVLVRKAATEALVRFGGEP